MGKPTGFLEYQRDLPPDRAPLERIKDWREFHLHFDREAERPSTRRTLHGMWYPFLPNG